MSARSLCFALVCGLSLTAVPAAAQEGGAAAASGGDTNTSARDREARTLFEAGRLAFADGRYEDSLEYFQRSYELSNRPALLFNVGASLDRLQRNDEALDHFRRYLTQLPDAPNHREVEARIDALEAAVEREREAEEARLERDRLLAERDARPAAAGPADDDESVFAEWWFWAIAGAAIAAGVVGVLLLSGGESEADPMMGNIPGISMTLRGP